MADTNKIEVYENNTLTITCTVSGLDTLSGYTATLTVKENENDADSDKLIESSGSITDLVIQFDIPAADNALTPGTYVYDIVITDGSKIYTIQQNYYQVLKSVKY
jgi:uncharacterized protein YaiI (UPF0178 family)